MNETTRPLTQAERDAFYAEEQARGERRHRIVLALLAPWADYLGEAFTGRQRAAVYHVLRQAVETTDYFGNKNVTGTLTVTRLAKGRKGSPNGIFSISVTTEVKGDKLMAGAYAHAVIGKRGSVRGSVFDRAIFGLKERKLGKGR